MMKITGLSHLFKWENLRNWWLTKTFFAPLYIRLFPSASHHQALAGSAPQLSMRGTSVLPQQTTTLLFCG